MPLDQELLDRFQTHRGLVELGLPAMPEQIEDTYTALEILDQDIRALTGAQDSLLRRWHEQRERLADVFLLRNYNFGQVELGAPPKGAVIVEPGSPLTTADFGPHPAGTVFRFVEGVHRPAPPSDQGGGLFYTPTVIPYVRGYTFVADPGAVVSGALVIPPEDWVADAGQWYAPGQVQRLPQQTVAGSQMCLASDPLCNQMEDFYYNGLFLRPVATREELVSGTYWLDYSTDRVYIADDPDGATVERTVASRWLDGNDDSHGTTVVNFVVEKFATPAQSGAIRGKRWCIENVEARLNHGQGLTFNESVGRNCWTHHNGQMGMGGSGRGVRVEFTRTDHNNVLGYNHSFEAGGCKFAFTEDALLYYVYADHNHGAGLWYDISNYQGTMRRCLSEFNSRLGIFQEIGYPALFEDCVARWNGYDPAVMWWAEAVGIQIANSTGVAIRGCLSEYNRGGPWAVYGADRPEDDPLNPSFTEKYGPWRLLRAEVTDNVGVFHGATVRLSESDNAGDEHAGLWVDDSLDATPHFDGTNGHLFDRNAYFVPEHPGPAGQWMIGQRLDEDGNTRPITFAEWQQLGFDQAGSIASFTLPRRLAELFVERQDEGWTDGRWQWSGSTPWIENGEGRVALDQPWSKVDLVPRVVGLNGTMSVDFIRNAGTAESRLSLFLRAEGGMSSSAFPRHGYHLEIIWDASDIGTGYLWRKDDGVNTFITQLSNIPAGQWLTVQLRALDDLIGARWFEVGAEPPAWTEVMDAAAPIGLGRPRLSVSAGADPADFSFRRVLYEEVDDALG